MSLSHQCSSALKKLHGCTNSVDKKLPPLTRRLEPFYQQSRYGKMSGATDLKLKFSRFLCFSPHINSTMFFQADLPRPAHYSFYCMQPEEDCLPVPSFHCLRKRSFCVGTRNADVFRGVATLRKVHTAEKEGSVLRSISIPRKFFLHPSIFVTFETMPMILLVSEAMDFVRAAYSL